MGDFSTFLFARPSFVEGMGRVLDLGDTLTEYNRSPNDYEADLNAAWADWLAIGDDLRGAMGQVADREQLGRVQ
jgi:hypothetical protein